MAIKALIMLKYYTFSNMEKPRNNATISRNLLRRSLQGTLFSGLTVLVSSTFSKYLVQERYFAPQMFKASSASCLTFAVATACCVYKMATTDNVNFYNEDKKFNERVSFFEKGSALVGWVGAAAAWASKYVTSNTHANSLAKHALSPLLGLGYAGSSLWLLHHTLNQQLAIMSAKRI